MYCKACVAFRGVNHSSKMLTTTQFIANGTPDEFAAVLKMYSEALRIKAGQKKKKKGESLEKLDR